MNINSKKYYVDLLNEFITNKIPDNEFSIIKLIDVGNFFILKGVTSKEEPLDIFHITENFKQEYSLPEDLKINTIDLIQYSVKDFNFNQEDIYVSVNTKYKLNNT